MKKWTVKYKTDIRVLTICIKARTKKDVEKLFEQRAGEVLSVSAYTGDKK